MEEQKKKSVKEALFEIYDKKYKVLLFIPILVLILSLIQIGYQSYTTGSFLNKDVSLKGGVTITVPIDKELDLINLERQISSEFPANDIVVRELRGAGRATGIILEADIDTSHQENIDKLLKTIERNLEVEFREVDYRIEIIGSSLGESFFRESLIALALAFLFMGLVVLIYFRTYVPSVAIILATFSDMAISLAVVNLLDIKIGTAGIAAFLMLIGYGVDTNILLTVRVLKRKEGSVMDRIISSVKTGMTMTVIAILTTIIVLLVNQSEVIRQIMIIMLVGLFADILNTWIQNVAILRIYLERQAKKGISV